MLLMSVLLKPRSVAAQATRMYRVGWLSAAENPQLQSFKRAAEHSTMSAPIKFTAAAFPEAAKHILGMAMIAVALLSLALPTAAQDKVFRVGLLSNGNPPRVDNRSTWRSGVLLSLDNSGYRLGRNLELVERYSEGHVDRLPSLAREIAAASVDVVVAIADPSVQAMMTAALATPIVMVVGADPVERGFVTSLARPGGRVTGLAFQTFEGDVKRLEIMREAMPIARRFGRLGPPGPIPGRATELLVSAASALTSN